MKTWQKILRNGIVVFGILLAQYIAIDYFDDKLLSLDTLWISLIIAFAYTMYEFKRLYKIELNEDVLIKQKAGVTTLLLA